MAVGSASGQVAVVDQRAGRVLQRWQAVKAGQGRVVDILPLRDGSGRMVTIGSDRTASVWRLRPNGGTHGAPVCETVVRSMPDVAAVRNNRRVGAAGAGVDSGSAGASGSGGSAAAGGGALGFSNGGLGGDSGNVTMHGCQDQRMLVAAAGHKIGTCSLQSGPSMLGGYGHMGAAVGSDGDGLHGSGEAKSPAPVEMKASVSSFLDAATRQKVHRSKLTVNCLHVLSLRRLLLLGTEDGHIKACV